MTIKLDQEEYRALVENCLALRLNNACDCCVLCEACERNIYNNYESETQASDLCCLVVSK